VTLYRCSECDHEVATNARVTAFDVPPTVYCYHYDTEPQQAYEMGIVDDADLDTESEAVIQR